MGGMSEAKIAEARLLFRIDMTLFVALWLELDNPFWAGSSAAIVCQRNLGLRCVR